MSSPLPIIFYDIPSNLEINAWSPNTWKTRYALNIKGVPYKTEWVEFPDIEATVKKIGAPTTDSWPSKYTLPVIYDPNTDKVISDSFLIAEYLDATYPDGPTLFPPGTKPLVASFEDGFLNALRGVGLMQLVAVYPILNPRSQEYFKRTREALFNKKFEEFSPASKRDTNLATSKQGFAQLDEWLAKSKGKFVLGDTISYPDCVLAGWLIWLRTLNDIWKDNIATWQNGRWATYLENVEKDGYATVK